MLTRWSLHEACFPTYERFRSFYHDKESHKKLKHLAKLIVINPLIFTRCKFL